MLTFKSISHITNIRDPLKIIWNDVEIDKKSREKDRRNCRDWTLNLEREKKERICK